ncbi:MAG: T9SS type A sorting domain-containing protein [Ignavibacteria bacterium]|nr:T9SS type A sorting domain-containing protein [Ignavibacteria bacterium]
MVVANRTRGTSQKNIATKKFYVVFLLLFISTVSTNYLYSQMWTPLGNGTNNSVNAIASYYNEVYVGGKFTLAGTVNANYIARWNGTIWQLVGSGLDAEVTTLITFNNELYAGGYFTRAGTTDVLHIAKWNGLEWLSVGEGLNDVVTSLIVFQNELYACGEFTMSGTSEVSRIARWDGTYWNSVGGGISGGIVSRANAMTVYDSCLIIGGDFTNAGDTPVNNIAKWNGTQWTSLANGVDNYVYALDLFENELVAGGRFTSAGGNLCFFVAKWNGTEWASLGTGVNNVVRSLCTYRGKLFVGGDFLSAGGTTVNYITQWNGTTWNIVGSGTNNIVTALYVSKDELYVGGNFTSAGGLTANNIAKLSSLRKFRTFHADSLLSEKAKKIKVKNGFAIGYPNISTVASNVFFHAGKKGATMLGIQQDSSHLAKLYAWMTFKTSSNLGKFYTERHTMEARPLDSLFKGKKKKEMYGAIKPKRSTHNNIAWEQGVIFNLNLLASKYGVLPTGFDSLIIDSATSIAGSTLKGISLAKVGKYYDSIMTYWKKFGVDNPAAYALLQTFVDSLLRPINEGFYAPLDTSAPDYNIDINEIVLQKNYYAVYLKGVKNAADVGIVREPFPKTAHEFLPASNENHAPQEIALSQNFPNPFNPQTTIRFTLSTTAFVSLKVYDILGREVAVLFNNEVMEEGEHDVDFDAEHLPSGMYLYRLFINNFSETKKFVLLK